MRLISPAAVDAMAAHDRRMDAKKGKTRKESTPIFAQQTNTPDPKLRQAVDTIDKALDEAQDKGDAAALAALFSDNAILVTNTGPLNGRKAIEEYYTNAFKTTQFSNTTGIQDPDSPHIISPTAMWVTGAWSTTVKGANWGPLEIKGYWGSIKTLEGGTWKILTETWNVIPPPAAAAAPSPTSSK
jgi:uncharacterized protein (TIGR02246 family)